jgi:uncharacterized protein DUF5666
MRRLMARCAVLVAGVALAVGGGAAAASATTTHTTAGKAPVHASGTTGKDRTDGKKPGPKPIGVGVKGVITAIASKGDDRVLTVATGKSGKDGKGTVTVLVTPKTSVTSGKTGEKAKLAVGETVAVKGLQSKDGTIQALAVVVAE